MASKVRRFLFWKVALYYGVLIALLLVLVGVRYRARAQADLQRASIASAGLLRALKLTQPISATPPGVHVIRVQLERTVDRRTP